MKASHVAALLAISCLGGITAFPDHGRADDILIEATGQTTWKAGGSQSDGPDNPLIVLAKKDDVLEIKALAGPHGFATLNKKGNESPAVEPKFVVACGETPDTKPDAVFLETECSRIGKQLFANMKLKVLDKFQSDIHFWCVIHRSGMWGTIRPRPNRSTEQCGARAPSSALPSGHGWQQRFIDVEEIKCNRGHAVASKRHLRPDRLFRIGKRPVAQG